MEYDSAYLCEQWAHEEELALKDGWRWSPDGTSIAFWQLHTSAVQWFDIIDNTSQLPYTKLTSFPYPKVGTENATARIGVLQLGESVAKEVNDATKITWLDLAPADGNDHYLASLDWLGLHTVAVQRMPRQQNQIDVLLCDVRSGASKIVFTEKEETWIGEKVRARQSNLCLSDVSSIPQPWLKLPYMQT